MDTSHHITNGNDIVLDSVQKYAEYYFQANVWQYINIFLMHDRQ